VSFENELVPLNGRIVKFHLLSDCPLSLFCEFTMITSADVVIKGDFLFFSDYSMIESCQS